ncbi:MAG: hypothetical protein E7658_01025 [Ruminococcaceae bacterium]|nr:hypothetical protein [Oscillospiraceae bacterium]
MFEWLWKILAGYRWIITDICCRTELMNLLFREQITFHKEIILGEQIRLSIPEKEYAHFKNVAGEICLPFTEGELCGLPKLIQFLHRRPGLPIGFAIFLLWCLLSRNLIWRIDITGNTNVPDSEIIDLLTELGCGIGDWHPSIDFDTLHAKFRAESDSIAWISVYMNGTVADVQVRESKKPDTIHHPENTYANIIAAEAGEIVIAEVKEGESAVSVGDVVMPGEMLISGVVQMRKENQYRLEYAAGRVLARVACPVSVEISLEQAQKVYTGREKTENTIKIFKKNINLFRNAGIPYTTYDTICRMEEVCLFDRWSIPVTITRTTHREYVTETKTITPEEAADTAMKTLREKISEAIGEGELLSQSFTVTRTEESCRIDCLLYCLKDIGKTVEFTASSEAAVP